MKSLINQLMHLPPTPSFSSSSLALPKRSPPVDECGVRGSDGDVDGRDAAPPSARDARALPLPRLRFHQGRGIHPEGDLLSPTGKKVSIMHTPRVSRHRRITSAALQRKHDAFAAHVGAMAYFIEPALCSLSHETARSASE